MKILFLDIDGVVNCRTTVNRSNGYIGIDPYMVLLVHRIIEATGCKVVLSSSWRHYKDSLEEVKKSFDLLSVTPNIPDLIRGYEIKNWLSVHNDIENYAILDDNNDMLPEQQDHFFKTTWEDGITQEIVNKVIKYLNE